MGAEEMEAIASLSRHEVARCDLCGSPDRHDVHPDIDVVRCEGCGLVYVWRQPRAEDLAQIYGEHYFRSRESQELGYDDYEGERDQIGRTFERRLTEVERAFGRGSGRLLDVGCAMGFFLEVARARGWEVEGIDVSAHAAETARGQLGLAVHTGTLADYPQAAERFDVVTAWDMIEHSLAPAADLARLAELVEVGGLLVLATPDVGSWPARLYGRGWIGIKPNEHFFYFSRETLGRYLERAGFRVERVHTIGKYVTVSFLLKRIGHYYPRLAGALASVGDRLGLSERAIYVDPRDLMAVYARRVEPAA